MIYATQGPSCSWIVALCILIPCIAQSQTKETHQHTQFWWSINGTTRLTKRWGVVTDFHIRRNDFLQDPSFYFVRVGSHFWVTDKFALTVGYAHMWQAPDSAELDTWSDENRFYQQMQYVSKIGSASVLNRLRNEQRWREEIKDDLLTGENLFSNRVRFLASFSIPVSKNPVVPHLVLSDEILVQFGSGIIANTFDQNRFFAGIKKSLSPSWSFDLGYMPVYQQKSSGYQYDLNHTLRWFFYFTPDFRETKSTHEPASGEE